MTSPQGDLNKAVMSLDEAEAAFTRRPETPAPDLLQKVTGVYQSPGGFNVRVDLTKAGTLLRTFPGTPDEKLLPYKGLKFRLEGFSDQLIEFVVESDQVKAFRQINPAGEYVFPKQRDL